MSDPGQSQATQTATVTQPFMVVKVMLSDRPPPGQPLPVMLTPANQITHHETLEGAIEAAEQRIAAEQYRHIFVYELVDGYPKPVLRWPAERQTIQELQSKLLAQHSVAGSKLGFFDWVESTHPDDKKRLDDYAAYLGPLQTMPLVQLMGGTKSEDAT